jgi:hypothetical protein
MRSFFLAAVAATLTGCTTPDLGPEVVAFSSAVDSVSNDYRKTLQITGTTVLDERIDAVVADRTRVIQPTSGCVAVAAEVEGADISRCTLDWSATTLPEGSLGRASLQLDLIAEYVSALTLLATSKSSAEVASATGAAIASLGQLGAATGSDGLSSVAAKLKERTPGITGALTFALEQKRFRLLRQITADADEPLQRILRSLEQTAVARGERSADDAFREFTAANAAMDDAKLDGSDPEYRLAIRNFLAAHEAYVRFAKTGLTMRLRLIAQTHAAVADRLKRPANAEDIVALLEKLKSIEEDF